jgi:hypothetical protein
MSALKKPQRTLTVEEESLRHSQEPYVKPEWNRIMEIDLVELRMFRVQQEVSFTRRH